VIDVQGFGTGLHVRIDAGATEADLRHALEVVGGASITSIERITPTLEDVFLAAADARAEDVIRAAGGAAS